MIQLQVLMQIDQLGSPNDVFRADRQSGGGSIMAGEHHKGSSSTKPLRFVIVNIILYIHVCTRCIAYAHDNLITRTHTKKILRDDQ